MIAQTLDYVSALASWSYADLQRKVSTALHKQGNIPFEAVRERVGKRLEEREFVNAVSRSLREGRVLALIAGDGIREGMQSLTDLVSRSATKAFSLGLIEVALYRLGNDRLVVQPRVLAKTKIIERRVTIVTVGSGTPPMVVEDVAEGQGTSKEQRSSGTKNHLKAWWEPILQIKFDDPDQEPPFWTATNNLVLKTPFPGIQIKAYALKKSSRIGVFISGPQHQNLLKFLKRERSSLESQLPAGTNVRVTDCAISLHTSDFESDDDKRGWIERTLNDFVNVLRPRLRKWYAEFSGIQP